MKTFKAIPLILLITGIILIFLLIPFNKAFVFTENRTSSPHVFYLLLENNHEFIIRYVHSIHLTDVIEAYEVTEDNKIRLVSMTYENFGIGLPSSAGEGETFSVIDGKYTLTFENKVFDSFSMLVGDVQADLAFRYEGSEIDLKEHLQKGKTYTFKIKKLSIYQLLRGVNLHAKG